MATRLYLCAAADPVVQPAFAAWGETSGALRRLMVLPGEPEQDALANGAAVATTTPGTSRLHRQYVSKPLAAGITWTSGTSTFNLQIQGLESAINDNIINRVRHVKVVSEDGGTIRATLVALGNAGGVTEWNTVMQSLTFMSGAIAAATYTTVVGDRLVVEMGHNDSAGASVSGTLRFGVTGQTGDLAGNAETETTTTLRPWFESSVNLTFAVFTKPTQRVRAYNQAVARGVSR